MMASASGRPSEPARTSEFGDPPTATQTGSGSCAGRGYTPAAVERGAVTARPGDPLRLAELEQQRELLGEQLVVVVEVVAEERERLDERAAPHHDLGAAAGQQVDRGEVLEDPDRVVRAEHGHRAREPDPLGARRDRRQGDGRRGHGEVGAVVLPDTEHVEPDLLGQLGLLEQVAHALLRRDAAGAERQLREGVEPDLHQAVRGAPRAPAAAARQPRAGRRRARGGEDRRGDLSALTGEHRVEQAGEAGVQIVRAQREQPLATVGTGADHAGLAQHPEVVRERGLGEAELEAAAGPFLGAYGQPAHDLEAGRITERVEHGRKLELLAGWVVRLSHGVPLDPYSSDRSMSIEPVCKGLASVTEVAPRGEHHRDAGLVTGLHDLVVAT